MLRDKVEKEEKRERKEGKNMERRREEGIETRG